MPINESLKFAEAFVGFEDRYVLIGGTATSIVLAKYGLESRTTKDYDMVLIDERKDEEFYITLTNFFEAGEYTPHILEKNENLFRFTTKKEGYPKMIELFSLTPEWFKSKYRITPVHFADDMSLSALLLDTDYYNLLKDGREIQNGYSVLSNKYLIIFKAKAWLDLTQRKEQGEQIDSKNIKKHLNDIARLSGSLEEVSSIHLPANIQIDMKKFLKRLKQNPNMIPKNKDILLTSEEVVQILELLF